MTERKVTVNALTRVEGEGALHLTIRDDRLEKVRLSIYEPPRFFEAFLRGRKIEEVPDITARICGICPIAYQMTSAHALEDALNIPISAQLRQLRRLIYCGEWIESHALHIYMLNAPDFFGCHSGIELAQQSPDEVNRGLQIKKIGNRVVEVLGGRAIHPINVRLGGFHRAPRADELQNLLTDLKWGLEASVESTRWVSTFDFPVFDDDCEFISLQHPTEYPMDEGRIASSKRDSIDVHEYEDVFEESQVEHSTALQSRHANDDSPYFLGPLARVNLNHGQLSPRAQQLAVELGLKFPITNRFYSIMARCMEVVHAFEEAIAIVESYTPPSSPYAEYEYAAAEGCAATEAPRGLIFHSYSMTAEGDVATSNIIPPTSQNQRRIEQDLMEYLPSCLHEDDDAIAARSEALIRTYDPCISCSTHFLKLTIDRSP